MGLTTWLIFQRRKEIAFKNSTLNYPEQNRYLLVKKEIISILLCIIAQYVKLMKKIIKNKILMFIQIIFFRL